MLFPIWWAIKWLVWELFGLRAICAPRMDRGPRQGQRRFYAHPMVVMANDERRETLCRWYPDILPAEASMENAA